MAKRKSVNSSLLPKAPLLITESEDEFDRIRDALNQEIKPRGIIEEMYVADIAHLVWEVFRLRRCKAGIVNAAFRTALQTVLSQVLRTVEDWELFELEDGAARIARKWFSDPDSKQKVAELLRQFELDETAIEAEAIRSSAEDIDRIDRLLTSAEARRDRALVCVARYRGDLGALLRETSTRMIEANKVLQLEAVANKQQKPAA
jgi:hypothetical protein